MKKIVKLMLSVMMIASMAACSSAPKNDQGGEGKFKAGTYTGTAQGNNGDVTVEVTLSADKIEKVEVTEGNRKFRFIIVEGIRRYLRCGNRRHPGVDR